MRKNRFGHNRVYVISDMSGERAQNEDEDDHDDDFRDMDQWDWVTAEAEVGEAD